MLRTTALIVIGSVFVVAGCAKKPIVADSSETELTSARVKHSNVRVSDELAKACHIRFDDAERAPKFAYDDDALLPEDRAILTQLARCVTSGPLKGQKLALVGRADPRGEAEYNMILGDHRAASVFNYLALLGVDGQSMASTTRGELDADGTDEDGWRRDRRVDIALGAESGGGAARASAPAP
jgi:peptidoglycan-associated lipoprotein